MRAAISTADSRHLSDVSRSYASSVASNSLLTANINPQTSQRNDSQMRPLKCYAVMCMNHLNNFFLHSFLLFLSLLSLNCCTLYANKSLRNRWTNALVPLKNKANVCTLWMDDTSRLQVTERTFSDGSRKPFSHSMLIYFLRPFFRFPSLIDAFILLGTK